MSIGDQVLDSPYCTCVVVDDHGVCRERCRTLNLNDCYASIKSKAHIRFARRRSEENGIHPLLNECFDT